MPTMKDIANKTNLSIATVSRIINGDATLNVREETRQKVLKTAKEIGYVKKEKNKNKAYKIGIVQWIPSYEEKDDFYYYNLRMSVENYCVLNNYEVGRIYQENINDVFTSNQYDGLICIGKFSLELSERFMEHYHAIVFLDSNPNIEKCTSVTSDLRQGTFLALSYLQEMGHKEIGFIGGREYFEDDRVIKDARESAFFEYVTDQNFPLIKEYYHFGSFSAEHGYDAMKKILSLDKKPTAIFCASDPIAMGALSALGESEYFNEISVIGFNNNNMSQYFNPPLTTVEINTKLMGEMACKILIEQLKGVRNFPYRVIYSVKLIKRDSVYQV